MPTIAATLKKTKRAEMLLRLDFGGLIKQWALRNVSVDYSGADEKLFTGKLKKEPAIATAFSFSSMSYSLKNIVFSIINDDRFQDEEARRRLDGSGGTVYIWAAGLDWANIDTEGVLFKGVFRKKSHDKRGYAFSLVEQPMIQFGQIPGSTINTDTWPDHRTTGGAGSVAGLAQPLVFGDWGKGIPLRCVDTVAFKYLAMGGIATATDADYTATTENVFDKDGAVIGAGNYTFYPGGVDGLGNQVAYFDFTGDQVASEPLSCSMSALKDGSGDITGTAGTVIEHPAEIIHFLIKHHTEMAEGDISVESLKTMKSRLPWLNFATIINSPADTLAVIDRILKQCCYSRIQRRGKVAVVGLHTDGPALANAKRFSQVGDITITKTPDDKVCNDLRIEYGLNPATGAYESELVLNRTNSAACEQSFYQYGLRKQVVLKYPDVQTERVAKALGNRYVSLYAYRHDIATRTTPVWEGVDVLEGDAGRLTVKEGPSADGNGWADELCILIDRTITTKTVKQRWWKVTP